MSLCPAQPRKEINLEDLQAYFVLNCAYSGIWPDDVDPQKNKLLRIGVLGRNSLSESFAAASERAKSTWFAAGQIIVKQGGTAEELADCQIILVSEVSDRTLEHALEYFSGKPSLLVGTTADFTSRGGAVAFAVEQQTLTFEVNVDELKQSHIELSSRFLSKASAFFKNGKRESNLRLKETAR